MHINSTTCTWAAFSFNEKRSPLKNLPATTKPIDHPKPCKNAHISPPAKIATSPTDVAARLERAKLSSAVDHDPSGAAAIAALNTEMAMSEHNGRDMYSE